MKEEDDVEDISREELENGLQRIKLSKADGSNRINLEMIKWIGKSIDNGFWSCEE